MTCSSCPAGQEGGGLGQSRNSTGNAGLASPSNELSCQSPDPVLYASGQAQVTDVDVVGAGFGSGWSHTRTYTNQMTGSQDVGNGFNWYLEDWPYLEQTTFGNGWLVLLGNANDLLWFELQKDSSWKTLYGRTEKLALSGGRFQLLYPNGTLVEFNSLTATSRPGQFVRKVSPGGVVTTVAEVLAPGSSSSSEADQPERILEVRRSVPQNDGTILTESFLYDFFESGVQLDRLQSCTLRRRITVPSSSSSSVPISGSSSSSGDENWDYVQRALYVYYDSGDTDGSLGDLKRVERQNFDGTSWVHLDYRYYRYWTSGAANGFVHGLKFRLDAAGWQNMVADGLDPLTATDAQLVPYARQYFEYDSDQQVSRELVDGGAKTWEFVYVTNSTTTDSDFNLWQQKTTVTRPDGAQEIVYTNFAGQVILHVLQESAGSSSSSGTPGEWCEYVRFDTDGRVILRAAPSAIAGFDESTDPLVTLHATQGLIRVFEYWLPGFPEAGWAPGFLRHESLRQGESGSDVRLRSYEYTQHTSATGEVVYPPSKETVYPVAGSTATTIVTTYAYTYHGTTNQIATKTTTLPVVPTGENGSGTASTVVEEFDTYGHLIRRTDERGIDTDYEFDTATGAMTRMTQDVSGLGLVTDYQHDVQGRTTESLGPEHEIDLNGVATQVRSATWTVYDDAQNEVRTAQGFRTSTAVETLVNPVRMTKSDASGKVLEQIAAVRTSTNGKLQPTDTFPQSSYVRWQTTQYTDCCLVASERLYHAIPVSGPGTAGANYAETSYGYDAMKRPVRTVSPAGTITDNVLDVRGNVTATYIGTNDTGSTSTDPTGGGAPGNNMVLVSASEYDNGLSGQDGNLTQLTQYADASTTRVTGYGYDWRDRRIRVDLPQDAYSETTYDNLDRVTRQDQKASATNTLIGREDTLFDPLGRVYRSIRYGVNPDTGAVGNALTDNTWYDRTGNVIRSAAAGSQLFTKTLYDSLGRATTRYVGFGADTTYSDPVSVSTDTILEQAETDYDAAGNVIESRSRQRYHDATGTGPLGDPSSTTEPKARVTYSAAWYDGTGRLLAGADYGTNGGAALVRPGLIPSRSDVVLVSSQEYDESGMLEIAVDPAGTQTRFEYDDAGRQTRLIENFQDGGGGGASSSSSGLGSGSASSGSCPDSADVNRTTQTVYTIDGQVSQLTAWNASTGDQTTHYDYGTTLSDSDIASAELLRRVRYPDSTGSSDSVTYAYNRLGQRTDVTDQRGCVHEFDYDGLGRLTEDRVTALPADVDGSVRRLSYSYEVRGLVEQLSSHDDANVGSGAIVNQVELAYNEFGQITADRQSHSGAVVTATTPKVQYGYENGSANTIRQTTLTYPDGRVLTYGYGAGGSTDDNASRVASITDDDSTQLVAYEYLGLGSFVETQYPQPDVRNTLISIPPANDPDTGDIYSGLDRFSRVTDCRWYNDGTSSDVDRFQYGYDRASNRLWRENVVAASLGKDFDELYSYDGLYRLKDMGRGRLNSGHSTLSPRLFAECWSLDETGNWDDFRQSDSGSAWTLEQTRTASEVNEITGISNTVGAAWSVPAYDPAGNMTTIPKPADPTQSYTATYDAWNRLIRLEEEVSLSSSSSSASGVSSLSSVSSSPQTVQENAYDARRFRILRSDYSEGTPSETRHFYYTSDWRAIEERTGTSTTPDRHFLWGQRYIDDLILRDRSVTGTLDERLYATQDANWNVTALAATTGTIQQRFTCDPYGTATVLAPAFENSTDSNWSWSILFTSAMLDPTTLLIHYRMRWMHPDLGHWLQRDPIQFFVSPNLYRYVDNSPTTFVDPYGLAEKRPQFECRGTQIPVPHNARRVLPGVNWDRLKRTMSRLKKDQHGVQMSFDDAFLLWQDAGARNRRDGTWQRQMLGQGCVGVTSLWAGRDGMRLSGPTIETCYGSFAQAKRVRDQWRKDGKCKDRCNFSGATSRPVIFAFRWAASTAFEERARQDGGETYQVCPGCGHVDWKNYVPSREISFDFGFYMEELDAWWHASTAEYAGGKIYLSQQNAFLNNPGTFIDPADANQKKERTTVYCVICEGDFEKGGQ